jgi:hypothetical protein
MSVVFPEVLFFSSNGRELLKSLIGRKIVRMFHYHIVDNFEEFQNDKDFQDNLQILSSYFPQNQFFSIIEGPLLVEFDSGIEISFFAEEPMLSIAFCLERNSKSEYMNLGTFCKPLDQQDRPFIDVNDTEFSNECMKKFLYKKIVDIKLFRKDGLTSSYRIKDSVISFVFEDSQQMILGYNVLNLPSVMSVVPWDLIPIKMRDNLFEVSIL